MIRIISGPDAEQLKITMLSRIAADLKAIRDGASQASRVLIVVPAQFTLATERMVFDTLGAPGFFDLHVMSGNKLRQEILRETGGPGKTPINSIGRAMLLRRIIAEKSEMLGVFRDVSNKPEFVSLAADFIVQLRQSRLLPAQLSEMRRALSRDSLLGRKLADMQQLCAAYDEVMSDKLTDSEGLLAYTSDKAAESRLIKDSLIWFCDFYSFTPNEFNFIGSLMDASAGLGFAVLCPEEEFGARSSISLRTLARLKEEAQKRGKEVFSEMLEAGERPSPELHLVRCSTPHTQAETIAAEVLELLRSGKASCEETAILTGDPEGCGNAIKRVFSELGIPIFADEKRSVQHDPAVGLISALLSMCAYGMRPDYIIGFMKSGLASAGLKLREPLTMDDTDMFESYVKRYRIRAEGFIKPFAYGQRGMDGAEFERLEEIREALAQLLDPFIKKMKTLSAVSEKTEALRVFLTEELALPHALELRSQELAERGCTDASGEIAQIWEIVSEVMDQAVELMGNAELSSEDFALSFEDAFRDIKVGLLPQRAGAVTLGTVGRSRLHGIKALFMAGVNEGQIPSEKGAEGILTEEELAILSDCGYSIGKSGGILAQEEALNIYRAMRSPTDSLWICYTLEDSGAAATKPSPIVLDLLAAGLSPEADVENRGDPTVFLTGKKSALQQLGKELRSYVSGDIPELAPVWKQTYNMLKRAGEPALDTLKEGLLFTNERQPLSQKSVQGLFSELGKGGNSDVFNYSPSELENYAGCAFRHLISYGLRPNEPRDFEISVREIGDIYHECLMRLCKKLTRPCVEKNIKVCDPASPWMSVEREELGEMVGEILDRLSEESFEGLFKSGPAEIYRGRRIRELALRFAWQMVLQMRRGRISSMSFETPFGGESSPIEVGTAAGKAFVTGRIDRVDISGNYLKVIDYKSGKKTLDREEVKQGYALQLMVYLEAALKLKGGGTEKELMPAGMFYYLIRDQEGSCDLDEAAAETVSEEMLAKIAESYKLNGLYVGKDEAISGIDASAVSEGRSDVIDYKIKKDGGIYSGSCLSEDEFEELRNTFRAELTRLIHSLNAGSIEANPRRLSQSSVCAYCDYKSICLFDTAFAANSYK